MIRRFRPERSPRLSALAGAAVLTTAVLLGVHVEARHDADQALTAVFTGEITADGPVYRLPPIEVRSRGEFLLALPELIQRAFDAHADHTADAARLRERRA
jgi:hypothetical protein